MICIIGASLAGDTAAATLRAEGYDGQIVMIGDEAEAPYDRPPLSKDALADDVDEARLFLRSRDWYEEQAIDLMLGVAATAIDPAAHTVSLANGETVTYSKLLIATGATARNLPGAAEAPLPVHLVRTLDDARALRRDLQPGKKVIVIGAGVIGLETAASAVKRGCEVEVIDMADRVLARVAPPEYSQYMADLHAKNGVQVHLSAGLVKFDSKAGKPGVTTENHGFIAGDCVVVGIGVSPNVQLAEAAGLNVRDGVLVDTYARTSDPDIYAVGDVARFPCPYENGLLRAENWKHAQDHAVSAVKNMLGGEHPYSAVQSMWSDQFDVKLQTCGKVGGAAQVERGDKTSGKFMTLYTDEAGVVVGAIGVNMAKDMRFAQMLVERKVVVDPALLADPKQDLRKLAA